MEYTLHALCALSGVTPRTLRFYDQRGLLRPSGRTEGNYRLYGAREVDRLQEILFYRALGVPLKEVKALLDAPPAARTRSLEEHLRRLCDERARLDALILTLERTISARQGGEPMTDAQKFEGFKRNMVEENERAYGAEARGKYGEQAVEEANAQMLGMSEERFAQYQAAERRFGDALRAALETGDPKGDAARDAVRRHADWLAFTWKKVAPRAQRGLAQVYRGDDRFDAWFDAIAPGGRDFFCDALEACIEE